MSNKKWLRSGLIYLLIIVAVASIFFIVVPGLGGSDEVSFTEVVRMAREGEVSSIEVRGESLKVFTGTGSELRSRIGEGTDITEHIPDTVPVYFKGSGGFNIGLLLNFLPLIFFGALIILLMRQAQGSSNQTMNFGRSKAKMILTSRPTVSFSDVAGADEAKAELEEVVEFLQNPDRFLALGARIPRGVLLVGPPGTGKTLLARAVAGEAAVPFFPISGSEFVEMFVGVGAARVRDLFDQAKRNSPCIVFVDEIDAVGRHRGAGLGGGHDEREQTLNQILVEMDGFETSTNIIVLAATNRPDILDPALLRPGRFDRRVVLDLPEVRGREAILKVHSKGKPLAPNLKLDVIAKETPGFSGADLANLVNEGALMAARRNKKLIGISEFEEAIDRVIAGPERKSRIINDKEKAMTAYHEAGHAMVAYTLPKADNVHKISIVARGSMGGYTRLIPDGDRFLWTKGQFEDMMATALGGRAAEEIVFGESTTGASNDLQRTTQIAQKMVKQYGMSEKLGPRTLGRRQELVFLGREIHEEQDYSVKLAVEIDEEVKDLITTAKDRAVAILEENRERLSDIAEFLIEYESVEGENLKALFEGRKPVIEEEAEEVPQEVEAPAQPTPAMDPLPTPHLASQQDDQPIPEGG
jgi:cell division protease FtsH